MMGLIWCSLLSYFDYYYILVFVSCYRMNFPPRCKKGIAMKSFSIIRKGLVFVLPLAACTFFGVLVAQEPRREQDKNAAPVPRSTNERPADNKGKEGTRNPAPANPAREGERGTRPEGGRPEAAPDAKERLLKELNLNKDERAKVESILAAREEKMREVQQSTMKAIRDAIGEEKFQIFMKNSANPSRRAGPANPPREGDKRPEAGKPEAGRPEGERKAGPANPPREGDRGARPEAGPEAKERMLNELNLSKDVRAKVEGIINTQQEKIKDVIAKGREANGDREKIMAEVRELQQNMAKSLKEAMGDEKFKAFMKNAPILFNRGVSPQGRDASR